MKILAVLLIVSWILNSIYPNNLYLSGICGYLIGFISGYVILK
jgi:hypothetical protein